MRGVVALLTLTGCNLVFGVEPTGGAIDGAGDGVPSGCWGPSTGDEDNDQRSDGCDPCPADPEAMPLDTDGDGVGDRCDPSVQALQRWVMFEGFHDGTEAWPTQGAGTWGVGDDALKLAEAVPSSRAITTISPAGFPDAAALFTGFLLADNVTFGLVLDFGGGIEASCLFAWGSPIGELILSAPSVLPERANFEASSAVRIHMTMDSNGRLHCDATTPTSVSDELRIDAGLTSTTATGVLVHATATPASVAWVSVIGTE